MEDYNHCLLQSSSLNKDNEYHIGNELPLLGTGVMGVPTAIVPQFHAATALTGKVHHILVCSFVSDKSGVHGLQVQIHQRICP